MSKAGAVPIDQTLFVRDHCLCLATRRAARAMSRLFDDAFRPVGITNGQFSLLHALNRPAPPSVQAVADLLAMDRTTLTANLKPLQRDGLVEIAADAGDRRIRRLVLTTEGAAVLARAMPVWIATHDRIDADLAVVAVDADQLRSGLAVLA